MNLVFVLELSIIQKGIPKTGFAGGIHCSSTSNQMCNLNAINSGYSVVTSELWVRMECRMNPAELLCISKQKVGQIPLFCVLMNRTNEISQNENSMEMEIISIIVNIKTHERKDLQQLIANSSSVIFWIFWCLTCMANRKLYLLWYNDLKQGWCKVDDLVRLKHKEKKDSFYILF